MSDEDVEMRLWDEAFEDLCASSRVQKRLKVALRRWLAAAAISRMDVLSGKTTYKHFMRTDGVGMASELKRIERFGFVNGLRSAARYLRREAWTEEQIAKNDPLLVKPPIRAWESRTNSRFLDRRASEVDRRARRK